MLLNAYHLFVNATRESSAISTVYINIYAARARRFVLFSFREILATCAKACTRDDKI